MSLFAELRRRNVFKVGAAYLVVAWLIIEIAAVVAPQLILPDWAPRLVTFLVLLGFPVTLVMAWMLEVSPEGIRIERPIAGTKRMLLVASVLGALAVGWFVRGTATWSLPSAPAERGLLRLAVLPLANFSPDPENAFFADGLHDDLLSALSQLQGVEVISRTTMATFKNSTKRTDEIASDLGATHLLEGSVRREADTVRLTVQLIEPRSDRHLWAQTYDRKLTDALNLQSAVADQVAQALRVALGPGTAIQPPTTVPAAYDLYLKSRLTLDPEDRLKLLDSALLLDPDFSLARAARAITSGFLIFSGRSHYRKELRPQVRSDIDRARKEKPELIEVDVAEGVYLYYVSKDLPGALAQLERVLARESNHPLALEYVAWISRRLGRKDEAIAAAVNLVALDPYSIYSANVLLSIRINFGQYRQAIAEVDQAIARFSGRDEQRTLREWRVIHLFFLTGDKAVLGMTDDEADGKPSGLTRIRESINGPTAKQLAREVAESGQWWTAQGCGQAPIAIVAAQTADLLGDERQRDQSIAVARSLYATLDPASAKEVCTSGLRSLLDAVDGRADEAIAAAGNALDALSLGNDLYMTSQFRIIAASVFARAGAKMRAVDLLEDIVRSHLTREPPAAIYHDPWLRKHLGDEPRFQALLREIESGFEEL